MTSEDALHYIGGALVYSGAVTAAGLGVARVAGVATGWHHAALPLSTLFVVFLALHPFPDPALLDCTNGGYPLMLHPFASLGGYAEFWARGRPLRDWLTEPRIMGPLMNVVLFMLPGAALALWTRRWFAALVFATGLTLLNEVTQLSALYGIYPCRYRYFSVDDLMFNIAGVLLGFGLWWLYHVRRR